MRTFSIVAITLVAVILASNAPCVEMSSYGSVAGNFSTVTAGRMGTCGRPHHEGFGLQFAFLQRFGHLGVGGETDYLRVSFPESQGGQVWIILANAEVYMLDTKAHLLTPYITIGTGLGAWEHSDDAGSDFIWTWGFGAQYCLDTSGSSAVFMQLRSLEGRYTQPFRSPHLLLLTVGYRRGI